MKITLIGPSYPYRGGISHYNTLLYRKLIEDHDVQFIGFKRQYPRFLYPGKDDKEEENVNFYEPNILRVIDSINPFTWFKAVKEIKKFKPDLIIIPWWVVFFAPQFWIISTFSKLTSNSKVLFICHNVIEHESNYIKRVIAKQAFKTADFFLVHSNEDKQNLKELLPNAKVKKAFLPTFQDLTICNEQGKICELRKQLGIEHNKVLLFFGFIRPYKGLKYLLYAMEKLTQEYSDIHLLIIGEFMVDKAEYIHLIQKLSLDSNITIVDHYVPSKDISNYFLVSDLVVLPYTSATQSGVIQIAYALNKPVVATNVGGLPEVILNQKTGYLIPSKDSDAIFESVLDFYTNKKKELMVKEIMEYKKNFSWDELKKSIEDIYTTQ